MKEVVVFLEFREDAEYFVEHVAGGLAAKSFQVVALDDDAAIWLAESGVTFVHVEDLMPPRAEGVLCGEIWKRLEALCECVDVALTDRIDFLEKGAPYLSAQIEVLKVIFDALILKIEILRAAFERWHPRKIYFARNELIQPTHHRLFFDESFSLYSVLLQTRLADIAGYTPELATWESRYKVGSAAGNQSKWWYQTARAGSHVVSSLRLPSIDRDSAALKVCVVGGSERSLQAVAENLRQGAAITSWRPQTAATPTPVGTPMARLARAIRNVVAKRRFCSELESACRSLMKSSGFLSFLEWKGVDFSDIVMGRLRIAMTANVAHQQVSMNEAKLLLPHVDILLSSYYSSFERPIAYLARRMGKKVVSVQHGAMAHDDGGYGWGMRGDPSRASNKHFFYTDMMEVDIKLAWGDAATAEMSKWRLGDHHPKVATMGAPHLAHLRGRRGSGGAKKRILFVANTFGNNTYVLMNFRGLAYRSRQYRLLRTLAAHPSDHEIIYKAYPSWARNEAYDVVRPKFPMKKMTQAGGNRWLQELFNEVDCVILDLPTTGFYEACVTDLPVFLFNQSCEFSEPVKAMIRRRVYYSEDIQEFCSMLDTYQSRPDEFPSLNDDSFVKAFSDADRKSDAIALVS